MPLVKSAHQDAALNSLIAGITEVWLCPAEPGDFAAANTSKLVSIAVLPEDFALANGDIDGRKVRFAGRDGTATGSGDVIRAVWVNTTNSTIEFVNNVTKTPVTSGGKVNINPFDIWEIGNPA